jgi:hypothetical protein
MTRLLSPLPIMFAAVTMLTATVHGQSPTRDRRLSAYAKGLPASKLDPQLPHHPFISWFLSVVGSGAKIDWEINDCGEQTGNPNDGSGSNPPLSIANPKRLLTQSFTVVRK